MQGEKETRSQSWEGAEKVQAITANARGDVNVPQRSERSFMCSARKVEGIRL